MSEEDFAPSSRVFAINTAKGVYFCIFLMDIVGVRVLTDPVGNDASWIETPCATRDWRETAHLVVRDWERKLECLGTWKHKNRNTVWAEALKHSALVLDSFIGGYWFTTAWRPIEKC